MVLQLMDLRELKEIRNNLLYADSKKKVKECVKQLSECIQHMAEDETYISYYDDLEDIAYIIKEFNMHDALREDVVDAVDEFIETVEDDQTVKFADIHETDIYKMGREVKDVAVDIFGVLVTAGKNVAGVVKEDMPTFGEKLGTVKGYAKKVERGFRTKLRDYLLKEDENDE